MSDAREILGMSRKEKRSVSSRTSLGRSLPGKRKKKNRGQREVALLSSSGRMVPVSCPPEAIGPGVRRRVRRWEHVEYVPAGRKDGLLLQRWRREEERGPPPYGRFSKAIRVIEFSPEEYEEVIISLDSDSGTTRWKRETTESLFMLCKQFDLRFVVISDRLSSQFPYMTPFSVEECASRYWEVGRALVEYRISLRGEEDEDVSKLYRHPLLSVEYDLESERKRKEKLWLLLCRTLEEVEEEREVKGKLNEIEKVKRRMRDRVDKARKRAERAASRAREVQSDALRVEEEVVAAARSVLEGRSDQRENLILCSSRDFEGRGVFSRRQRMMTAITADSKLARWIDSELQKMILLGADVALVPSLRVCKEFDRLRLALIQRYGLEQAIQKRREELQHLRRSMDGSVVPAKKRKK